MKTLKLFCQTCHAEFTSYHKTLCRDLCLDCYLARDGVRFASGAIQAKLDPNFKSTAMTYIWKKWVKENRPEHYYVTLCVTEQLR